MQTRLSKKGRQGGNVDFSNRGLSLPAVCEIFLGLWGEGGISGLLPVFQLSAADPLRFPRLPGSQMLAAAVCSHVCNSYHYTPLSACHISLEHTRAYYPAYSLHPVNSTWVCCILVLHFSSWSVGMFDRAMPFTKIVHYCTASRTCQWYLVTVISHWRNAFSAHIQPMSARYLGHEKDICTWKCARKLCTSIFSHMQATVRGTAVLNSLNI